MQEKPAGAIDERLISGSGAGSRYPRSPAAPWERSPEHRIRTALHDPRVRTRPAQARVHPPACSCPSTGRKTPPGKNHMMSTGPHAYRMKKGGPFSYEGPEPRLNPPYKTPGLSSVSPRVPAMPASAASSRSLSPSLPSSTSSV